ncbi:F-box/FBD/LRR-repeat protein At5g22660-like [Chenopodium quinoa]|uniref:F-box/FBD/LRR-repeat protein At5g22660-like n=1 Tax=Chenopodium quinoa TaxID=63459 RepID=UPI000B7947A3|nr:F-box/FBD/LRR-repeat protein At5g22660-like [Chenopodium quinoa]
MAETKIVVHEDDRLSSLPEEILINILSFLPIHSAATTSVLSHRWRHLWTGVTSVVIDSRSESTAIIDHILQNLTSRKLHKLALDLDDLEDPEVARASVPWFRQVCRRNVENIIFTTGRDGNYSYFIPSFLFNSQSLVTLDLDGVFQWPKCKGLRFHLPNLKKLIINYLDDIPLWLETLIRSSPLLELLDLFFEVFSYADLSTSVVNIIAPNLKSLSISMTFYFSSLIQHARVCIDAPKLANLKIHDCNSIYYFLRNPTTLVKAHVYLDNIESWQCLNEEDEEDHGLLEGAHKEYLRQVVQFVGGLSSVSSLKLKLESPTNIFRYRSFVNLPTFSNLTRLETKGTMDLLCYLHCFPNLVQLVVCLWSQPFQTLSFLMKQSYWLPPDSIPDCLLGKLKTIQLSEIQGTDDTLRLLAYILSNANVLEKLYIRLRLVERVNPKHECEEAYAMWKESQFCKSLFKLPRRSSTCEVVFSGSFFRASGNALPGGYLSCQMYVGR